MTTPVKDKLKRSEVWSRIAAATFHIGDLDSLRGVDFSKPEAITASALVINKNAEYVIASLVINPDGKVWVTGTFTLGTAENEARELFLGWPKSEGD